MNDTNNPTDLDLTYFRTDLGGCNGQNKSITSDPDTVIFSITNDTLTIFVGFEYICCAEFLTNTELIKDTVKMYITKESEGECDCYCYYTFDFIFENYNLIDFHYQVYVGSLIKFEGEYNN